MAGGFTQQQTPQPPVERFLTFFGPINAPASIQLRLHLSNLIHQNARKVTLLFASSGGATDDGMALFTYLRALPYELTIHAIGPVSSIAVPVFLAADRQHRMASKNARFLIHEFTWNIIQQNGAVTPEMLRTPVVVLADALEWSKGILRAETNLTDADFENMKMFNHPVMMDPNQAMNHGIVFGIAEPAIPAGSFPLIVA